MKVEKQDVIGLVKARAHAFASTTGLPYDELESEALLAYAVALNSYDDEKSALSTWVFACVTNALINWSKNEGIKNFYEMKVEELPEVENGPDPFKILAFKETLLNLSEEAQEIVRLILIAPEEVVGLLTENKPGAIRSRLRYHMQETLGWGWHKQWKVTNELKEAMR